MIPKRRRVGADAGLVTVFRNREFRAVWFAELLSILGDQLARVALAVLVYDRTGSAAWVAVTYALTYLPALMGGVLLSGLADRFRRREVMVAVDVVRAILIALMAIPRLDLWVLCSLLTLVVLLGAPHTAAYQALLPDLLAGELYERGLAVRQITSQSAQLVGFATGGLLVAGISSQSALLADAVTFALSAVLVRWGVADRPRAGRSAEPDAVDGAGGLRGIIHAMRALALDPRRRALVLLVWLVGLYVVPEALAAPVAEQFGAGPAAVGLLMAADPIGSVLGAWLFVRFVPSSTRTGLIGVLAVAAGLPLVGMLMQPGLAVTFALWAISGACSTPYLLQAQASFVRATPEFGRGQAIGLVASGIVASQGVAVLAGGLLADVWSPATAIAACAAAGTLLSLGGAIAWHRASRSDRATAPAVVTG